MSNNLPNWLTGAGVTAIVITPLSVNPDGSFVVGSAQSLTGRLDEILLEQTNTFANITPLDERQDNEAIVASGTTLTLVEILAKLNGCILSSIGNSCDYVQAGFARGGHTYSGTFVIKSYRETIRRGKSVGELVVSPCGVGVSYV